MVDLGVKEALQYQKDIKSGKIKLDPKPGKNYLDQFIKNRIITPAAGAVDLLTTGTLNTDLDKKGDSGLQTNVKNVLQKTKERIFNETGTVEKPELGDSFDQDKFYKNLYGLQAQQSVLRDYELGREANRQFAMMQRTLPLVDLYSETAAKRRLMEDQFSPTKISQQRLRAQTGEATLMQAIASQGSTAAQIGNIGTSRRYGR